MGGELSSSRNDEVKLKQAHDVYPQGAQPHHGNVELSYLTSIVCTLHGVT